MQILVLGIFVGFSQAEEVAENSRLKKICKHDTMWKFQVFLSFRLYVKSILENVKSSKVPFLGALNLVIWLISNCAIIHKNQNSESLLIVQNWLFLDL